MSIRLSLVLMYLLLMVSASQAQSDLPYQLRVPTADEYLAAIPSILTQAEEDYSTGDWNEPYSSFVYLTWSQLREAYGSLSDHPYELLAPLHSYYTDNYLGGLGRELVTAWLREHPVNFDNVSADNPLTFGDITITASLRDFNADRQHEWILDINQNNQYRWKEVLRAVGPGEYEEIKTPLFMFDAYATYYFISAGFSQELAFKDLNQDGLPEWVIAVGGIGGGHENHGFIQILQWQDGQLVDLAEADRISYSSPAGGGGVLFPYGISVQIEDVDDNGSTEIRVQQHQYDNWGCTWTQTRIYGWKHTRYTLLNEARKDDDVKGCAWADAEEAMWDSDYNRAIMWYEQAMALPFAETLVDPYYRLNTVWEYEQLRLALAYALTHQDNKARETIRNLQSNGIHSTVIHQMSAALWPNIGEAPATICQAVYNIWFSYIDAPIDQMETDAMQYWSMIPFDIVVGYTKTFASNDIWPSLPTPEKAGCDITAYGRSLSTTRIALYLDETRASHPLPMPSPPPIVYPRSAPITLYEITSTFESKDLPHFLVLSRFYLMQIQQGLATGDEWMARYLFATALRLNNRPDEALEQYVYIHEHSPLKSWRQLANLYLQPIITLVG